MGLHCLAESRPSALLTLAPDPGLDDKLHPHLGIVQLNQGEPGANSPPPPLASTGPRARLHVRSLEEQEWAESQPVGGIGPVIDPALFSLRVTSLERMREKTVPQDVSEALCGIKALSCQLQSLPTTTNS